MISIDFTPRQRVRYKKEINADITANDHSKCRTDGDLDPLKNEEAEIFR
jgi:hypothetical protein